MFRKYARAISDEGERRAFYRRYLTRNILIGVFYAFLIAAVAVLFAGGEPIPESMLVAGGGIFLGAVVCGLTALCLHISMRRKFREILSGQASADEMPEVVAYREKMWKSEREERRRTGWALAVMIFCIAAAVALVIFDSVKNPDTDEISPPFLYGAVALAVVGVLVYFFAVYFSRVKHVSEGKTAEGQIGSEAARIDEIQGRAHRYRIEEDPNLQSLRYLFPNEELRGQAEKERGRQTRRTGILTVVGILLGVTAAAIFFSGWVFPWALRGFAIPVCFALVFGMVLIPSIPVSRRLAALEKRQLTELQMNPAYAKNLEIYRLYARHAKTKGRVLYFSIALSVSAGFVLAVLFPNQIFSAFSLLILLAGLFLNYKYVQDLRKKVLPIEKEIDEKNKIACEQIDNIAGK